MSFDLGKKSVFDGLIGQPLAISVLQSVLEKQYFAPAYLFTGPEGVGRRLAALRFLEGILTGGHHVERERRRVEGMNHPDLLWVEPTYLHQGRFVSNSKADSEGVSRRTPPQIRLEQVRGITRFLGRQPIESKRSMVVIECIDSMAEGAANALLKTLEEPGNGLLILLSTSPERLLATIRSRCQQILFKRLDEKSLRLVFQKTRKEERLLEISRIDQPELLALAEGSPGALLKHLGIFEEIPKTIWSQFNFPLNEPINALTLAREITEELDGEQQLWLIDWLQQHLWRQFKDPFSIRRLDKLRFHLLRFVQPRLAWEVAFLEMISHI